MRWLLLCCSVVGALIVESGAHLCADEKTETPPAVVVQQDVSELTERAIKSIAVITFSGRDGDEAGLGAGFIIDPNGLIATNMHVIGEARPITVKLSDGRSFPVKAIHSSDKHLDLAILKIDATELPALELGDSDATKQGQPVIALGNPRGLRYSVVSGLLSGKREIEEREMLQIAIPIEQGNSGGPLLSLDGKVLGIITLKSLVTDNLGFAVPINSLKPLVEKPNPVPMDRWLTIGVLNPRDWTTLFGSIWRQRAGRIQVEGAGQGFGGRSIALSTKEISELPYEIEVSVKLGDESGAAGLVFDSNGREKHFGFYPSSGTLRLTRFEGPDVFSWHVLQQIRTEAYKPGEWNRIKVHVEADRLICFVNGIKVAEEAGMSIGKGKVGLAKFRDTEAEFKGFRIGKELTDSAPSPETVAELERDIAELDLSLPPGNDVVESFAETNDSPLILQQRARQMELEAQRLKQLASDVHQRQTIQQMVQLLSAPEEEIDLLHIALLVSRLDNPDLEIDAYLEEVDRMAGEIREAAGKDASPEDLLRSLDNYLFEQLGYHGSRHDYYNQSNSYLNEVIDDREGLPITLSVLYIELGRRLDLPIVGVGLPSHFIVRYQPPNGESQLIDPFDKGKRLTEQDAAELVLRNTGRDFDQQDLATFEDRQIIERMLNNLFGIARDAQRFENMRTYCDSLVAVVPEEDRYLWYRAVLNYQTKRHTDALADADALLLRQSLSIDRGPILELKQAIQEMDRKEE